jgi:hypothetical protein
MNSALLVLFGVVSAIVVPAVVEIVKDRLLRQRTREVIQEEFQRKVLLELPDAMLAFVEASSKYQIDTLVGNDPTTEDPSHERLRQQVGAVGEYLYAVLEFRKVRSMVVDDELRTLLDEWAKELAELPSQLLAALESGTMPEVTMVAPGVTNQPFDQASIQVTDRIRELLNRRSWA